MINTDQNVNFQTLTVGVLIQNSGTGTTTFNGPLTISGVTGLQLTGTDFTFNDNVTTLNSASIVLENSGTAQFASGIICSCNGFITQSGSGPVSLAGTFVPEASMVFAGPTSLSATTSLSTVETNQNITFMNTLDGPGNITVAVGAGNFTIMQPAGSTTRLGDVLISSAQDITTDDFTATTVSVPSSTGTMTLNGDLNTNGVAGIVVSGNNFVENGSVTTTNGGPFTITNSGILRGEAGVIVDSSISGPFTQNGTGPVLFCRHLEDSEQ